MHNLGYNKKTNNKLQMFQDYESKEYIEEKKVISTGI